VPEYFIVLRMFLCENLKMMINFLLFMGYNIYVSLNLIPERIPKPMYSPKISEELIPIIYTKSKEARKSMTKYVNEILRSHLVEKVEDKPITTESTNSEIKSKVA